eukprot:CAMPEP_0206374392 /NCGR_PEP_ID=MMETSP0294-20121207/8280_1 /ASSEMBLY_ACC=CAM_ASM_000327 /TAXON_ID=39354 /ORGANISM="Heterosigma akashiwo, Strain CCMP2393" /LENGTH=174 /DNA_ID=CAMNT_0053822159 /DNA_START=36 /DNA_END=556 /DNA_ORIENTATION=+
MGSRGVASPLLDFSFATSVATSLVVVASLLAPPLALLPSVAPMLLRRSFSTKEDPSASALVPCCWLSQARSWFDSPCGDSSLAQCRHRSGVDLLLPLLSSLSSPARRPPFAAAAVAASSPPLPRLRPPRLSSGSPGSGRSTARERAGPAGPSPPRSTGTAGPGPLPPCCSPHPP